MSGFLMRNGLGWGFALWLFGYLLGFAFYAIVPPDLIGWYVMPLGIAATCLVLWKWVRLVSMRDALLLGMVWCAIAIIGDYLFIVKLLNPPDGYYRPDIYLYYLLTLTLPLAAAWLRGGTETR
ncbi:MAG: hypothetical protein ABI705_13185 [Aestuariivirga sp.]